MGTVLKDALGIEHYWGRVEFAPGRGQIHLHMLGIAKDMAYLKDFYKAQTMEDKGVVVDKYARETLDLYADVDVKDDDRNYFPVHPETPLSKNSARLLMKLKMLDFCARTVCVTTVTDSVCGTARKINHAPVAQGLVMRLIMVDKTLQGWISGKSQNW